MSKNKLVIFTPNNARIITNPSEGEMTKLAESQIAYVMNPKLERVKGIPPHLWKLENGEVYPMSDEEAVARTQSLMADVPKPQSQSFRHEISEYKVTRITVDNGTQPVKEEPVEMPKIEAPKEEMKPVEVAPLPAPIVSKAFELKLSLNHIAYFIIIVMLLCILLRGRL